MRISDRLFVTFHILLLILWNMESTRLDKDLIADPCRWRLAMQFGPGAIDVVAYSPMEDNSLLHRRILLDTAASSPLKALEGAVYDNPLLLSDFGHIHCLVDSPEVMVAPREAAGLDADRLVTLMAAAVPGFDGVAMANDLPAANAAIVMGLNRDTWGFLTRTFFNADIQHHLTPLCRYFLNVSRRANSPRVYANLRTHSLDVVAVDRDRLLMANTFRFDATDDAAYYILASRRQLGLDSAEMFLTGDASVRELVAPVLRRFISAVMPVIFPSAMFRAGKDALGAPFELIVLPLCE